MQETTVQTRTIYSKQIQYCINDLPEELGRLNTSSQQSSNRKSRASQSPMSAFLDTVKHLAEKKGGSGSKAPPSSLNKNHHHQHEQLAEKNLVPAPSQGVTSSSTTAQRKRQTKQDGKAAGKIEVQL